MALAALPSLSLAVPSINRHEAQHTLTQVRSEHTAAEYPGWEYVENTNMPSGRGVPGLCTGKWGFMVFGGELLETSVPGPPLAVMPTAFTNGGTPALPTPALPTPPPAMIAPRQLPPVPVYTPAMPPTTPQPAAYPPYAAAPAAPASMAYGSGTSAAVASAVLQSSSSPAKAAAYSGVAPSASLKVTSAEAVAVLSARLQEAVGALSDSPIRDAGMYVVMVKDIALAIAALKAL